MTDNAMDIWRVEVEALTHEKGTPVEESDDVGNEIREDIIADTAEAAIEDLRQRTLGREWPWEVDDERGVSVCHEVRLVGLKRVGTVDRIVTPETALSA